MTRREFDAKRVANELARMDDGTVADFRTLLDTHGWPRVAIIRYLADTLGTEHKYVSDGIELFLTTM